jgi:hypothetical protein
VDIINTGQVPALRSFGNQSTNFGDVPARTGDVPVGGGTVFGRVVTGEHVTLG